MHKWLCTLAVQGQDRQLRMLPSMENTRENWLEVLAQLPLEAEIALEVSTSGHFRDERAGGSGLARAIALGAHGRIDSLKKQKYDRLDAKRLRRKLSVAERDPLPESSRG